VITIRTSPPTSCKARLKSWTFDVLSTEAGLIPLPKILVAKLVHRLWCGFPEA
jgi:hypothetical protein